MECKWEDYFFSSRTEISTGKRNFLKGSPKFSNGISEWKMRVPFAAFSFLEHQLVPWGRFSKAPESFRARKAIFKSSVSKNGEVYTLETSCMKGTSLHL